MYYQNYSFNYVYFLKNIYKKILYTLFFIDINNHVKL